MPYSSLSIANHFLGRARRDGKRLTNMQLQKLVFLAHGWNLAVNGEPLIEDDIEAWEFGPVIRRLYDAASKWGRDPVTRNLRWGEDTPFRFDDRGDAVEDLRDEEERVVETVWKNYGHFPAFRLSALTHVEGSPWANHYRAGRNRVIPDDDIRDYFVRLATERRA